MTTAIAPHQPALPLLEVIRRHPVAAYLAGACLFSWAYWIPLALRGARVDFGSGVTHVPGLFGPALAALLVAFVTSGTQGVLQILGASVGFRGRRSWLAFAALTPIVLYGAATLIAGAPPIEHLGIAAGFPEAGILPLWGMLLIAAWGEEAGWRGFALEHLQQHRPALSATVLVTAGWALWHAPAFFFLASYSDMSAPMVAGFFLALLGGSFVLTWLYNRTGGSVLMVSIWHASFNLVTMTRAGRGEIAMLVSVAVMLLGFALAIADLRARNQARPAVLS